MKIVSTLVGVASAAVLAGPAAAGTIDMVFNANFLYDAVFATFTFTPGAAPGDPVTLTGVSGWAELMASSVSSVILQGVIIPPPDPSVRPAPDNLFYPLASSSGFFGGLIDDNGIAFSGIQTYQGISTTWDFEIYNTPDSGYTLSIFQPDPPIAYYVDAETGYMDVANLQGPADLSVPEPATWALMILGFGGAGAVLRGRRRLAAEGRA